MNRRLVAGLVGGAVLAGALVALPAGAAHAATVYAVNSLEFVNAADVAPGDGVCATATGVCTLKAALQEANHTGNATVTVAEGWSGGTIAATSATSEWMYTSALSPGSTGAYFLISGANITLDLKDKLSISTPDDSATAVYISGKNATVRNVKDVFGGKDSFQVSGAGVTLEKLDLRQTKNYNAERAVVVRNGADGLTIADSVFSGYYGTGAAGEAVLQFDAAAAVSSVSIRGNSFLNPGSGSCSTSDGRGCRRTGISAASGATVSGLSITGNTFDGNDSSTRPPIRFMGVTSVHLSDLLIAGNTFSNQATGGVDGDYTGATVSLPYLSSLGGTSSVRDNTFESVTADGSSTTAFGVVWWGPVTTANSAVASGLTISANRFDGYSRYGTASTSVIRLYQTGVVTVEGNLFGPSTVALTGASSETSINAGLFANYSNTSNRKIGTWYPSAAVFGVGGCTLQVTVAQPSSFTAPRYPARLDFFYTKGAGQGADELVDSRPVDTNPNGMTFELEWGDRAAGSIRIQSHGDAGAQRESSQYSRQLTVAKSACGPSVTVEQAAGQGDPTYERSIHFVVTTSEALADSGSGALRPADFDLSASSAPGVRVTEVTRRGETVYDVWARADDSGSVVLTLPAGAVTDLDGNGSAASTSRDNAVEYRNPLSLSATTLVVYQGQVGKEVRIERVGGLAPSSPVVVTATVSNEWVAASSATLEAGATAAASVVASAADLQGIERTASLSFRVSSADPNFDGLLLPTVSVTAQHAELIITKQAWLDAGHTVELPTGSVVEDGRSCTGPTPCATPAASR